MKCVEKQTQQWTTETMVIKSKSFASGLVCINLNPVGRGTQAAPEVL